MTETDDLIASIHEGLLAWYPYKKDAAILSIGDWADIGQNVKYDYVISITDIEKEVDPFQFLIRCRKVLKPDGHLLLAVNNRFGVKYFCGDRDIYTQRNFDGIENYKRAYSNNADVFKGRCYSKAELKKMLKKAGFEKIKFFSVLTDLDNPSLIYAEDFLPNEELTNRVFPTYNYPASVFLEEASLYTGLIENDMFHQMANAYLIECSITDELSDVSHVTSSMERGREDAMYTIIHNTGMVEKRAAFPEGLTRIQKLKDNERLLSASGIKTVKGEIKDNSYVMPFIEAKTGQTYLKELLYEDKQKFLEEMDHFRDLILRSAPIISEDKNDGEGAILKYGFLDMVPLNSFHIDDTFVFYDQEFVEEDYPANVLLYRLVATFYAGDMKAVQVLPMNELLERYGLWENKQKWQKMEWEFLYKLRNQKELLEYHQKVYPDGNIVNSNRQRMNFSSDDYQRLFVDIFNHADTRKLFLFGSGNFTKKFLTIYGKDYDICGIIDNNPDKWGQQINGIKIQSPDIIKDLKSGEYKVIICIKNYISVMKQLDEMGVGDYSIYDWNKNYPRKLKPILSIQKEDNTEPKKYHIGYVAGAFDMFHIGHLNLLRRAKEMCDYLIVGVIADETVYNLKKKKPIIPCDERTEIVAACRYVDQAEALSADYAGIRDAYKMFHFDVQFSGDDHGDDKFWQKERRFLEKQGADIVFFPYTEKVSSTELRTKLGKDM